MSFDEWFKNKFNDLHEACCCGDLVAMKYKKAMKKAWNEQQKNIDAIDQSLNEIYDACDENETVAMLLDKIKELLK